MNTHIYAHVCTHVYMHACTHVYIHIHIHACTHVCARVFALRYRGQKLMQRQADSQAMEVPWHIGHNYICHRYIQKLMQRQADSQAIEACVEMCVYTRVDMHLGMRSNTCIFLFSDMRSNTCMEVLCGHPHRHAYGHV